MSFKDLFDEAVASSAIANKSPQEIGAEVESVGYHEQDIISEDRFIPNVDYNDPGTFARYGSAEEYYVQSLERVYDTYPYDGSLKERLEWENSSTYIDLYLLDNKYPRTNGYINLSYGGWGSGGALIDGYSLPASTEYIFFKGGPHPNADGMSPYATSFTGSNYYEPETNRASNLKYDLDGNGVTVEFWLKKDAWVSNQTKEVVFDLWNGVASGSSTYGRLRIALDGTADGGSPVVITARSGALGPIEAPIGTSLTIADSTWHHYALSFASASSGVATKLYVDGTLNTESTLGAASINAVTGALRAQIGALITSSDIAPAAPQYAGKLSGSLDEFRYWKKQRTSQDIGRYWFTQVGGGTNSDPTPYSDSQETVNTQLGVYFKFNEGITGVAATDATVLDYSGRVSNGAWTGYAAGARETGSAMVISLAAAREFKDPIIYSFHPDVVTLKSELETSGSSYDDSNSTSIYKSIPSWITEDDDAGQHQLKYLTQIVSSYFDTLHMQIAEHNKLRDVEYVSGSNKPFPHSNRLLNSQGFISPDIFVDADLFEQLADRSENKLYEKSLSEIKNIIYQNIYNNLSYIYKSKGTEKAFRNLIRCFGIDDELIKLSMYAHNTNYEFRENRRTVLVNDRTVNFNSPTNKSATVYSFADASNTNSTGFISASSDLADGYAVTLEADIFFPQKPSEQDAYGYFNTNALTSSLFGVHQAADNPTDTKWAFNDATNFQVFSVRDELDSSNVRFMLTGTAGGYVPYLITDLFEDVYADTSWNLSTRIRPERFPYTTYVSGADTGNYVVELAGVQTRAGEIVNTFTVSGTVTNPPDAFITGSRRVFLGAHKNDITGSTVYQTSDVRVNACRFWLDYVEDEALQSHALDTENFGPSRPGRYATPWDKTAAGTGEVTELDTLAFNWEFSENTGSNASGKFTVADESSGSAALAASRYGFIGQLAGKQITAQGQGFEASSTTPLKKEFMTVSRLNELEVIAPAEMVKVLGAQEQQVFKVDSRPVQYYYAFEKSLSKVISEEMVAAFGTLRAFNTLVGQPVNRYRNEYKNLNFLRQKFFEKVGNDEIDFDKFYEFYKWFDSSLSYMLGQLIPASADFAQNIRTSIESTTLERSKYRNEFPFLEQPANDFTASIGSNVDYGEAISSPDDDLQGTGFYPVHAPTRRSVGLSPRALLKKWKYDHAPPPVTVLPGDAKSILFDGADEYLRGSDASTWNGLIGGAGASAKAFSVSFWTNPQTIVNQDRFWNFGNTASGHRNLMFYTGTGKLIARCSTSTWARTNSNVVTTGAWYHVVVTFAGGDTAAPVIYVNAAAAATTTSNSDSPAAFTDTGLTIAAGRSSTSNTGFTNAYMCDLAVWDKALSADEVTEIYGSGKRVYLSAASCASSLLSWYRMGSDPRDTYNGTIYDQTGGRDLTPYNLESADIASVSPLFSDPYHIFDASQKEKMLWWRDRAERNNPTIKESTAVNNSRAVILQSIREHTKRTLATPYRFSTAGNRILGGVGQAANKDVNFVFEATQPYGPTEAGKTAPLNVMVSVDSDVESLLDTTDEFYPTYKQRLGFAIDPGYSRTNSQDSYLKGNGNKLAPFSLYESTVDTGYQKDVTTLYKSGVEITNLHHDFVDTTDVPLQGPFTEKYVGGRQFRHTTLNSGPTLDTPATRGEGYRIVLGQHTGSNSGSLAVVPPNSGTNALGWDPALPTAQRFRDETAKRPVNIRNIQMRTGSTILGNYEKNYQVVQTSGRSLNDPYFQDQSFDFAQYPETLATRGRFPLTASTANVGGNRNYELPERAGSNSNQTVIVNRFSAPGSYEVMSRGYMDPAHEEVSGCNAAPYRNQGVINYGLSGSASVDPVASKTITVVDQIGKNRGLDQRATLHCGPFGSDAAYGTVPELTYVTKPSWHKTNRNRRRRIESSSAGYVTASVYDNLFVQHQIPRSEQQYSWITSSLNEGATIYGLAKPSCIASASVLTQVVSGAEKSYYGETNGWHQNFSGYSNRLVIDNVDTQTHLQQANYRGPLSVGTYSAYFSSAIVVGGTTETTAYNYITFDGSTSDWSTALGNDPLTISYWVYMENGTVDDGSVPSVYSHFTIGMSSGVRAALSLGTWFDSATQTLRFFKAGTGTNGEVKSSRLDYNRWYHVAVTYDGTNPGGSNTVNHMKIYIDGVNDTSIVTELNTPATTLGAYTRFGQAGSGLNFFGHLTDLGVWDDDLSAANVLTLYNNGRPIPVGSYPDSSDLIAYWAFSTLLGDVFSTTNPSESGFGQASIKNRSPNPASGLGDPTTQVGRGAQGSRFSPNSVDGLNILVNNRQGPYGWPTWKQIRTGESKTARALRNSNMIGLVTTPPLIPQKSEGRTYQYVRGKRPNSFVDYFEAPISSRYHSTMVCLEDNTEEANVDNNLSLNVSYGNLLDHFSNQALNNRLNVPLADLHNNPLNSVFEYVTSSDLTTIIDYGERVYPAETNAYKNVVRRRTEFNISGIWNDLRANREASSWVDVVETWGQGYLMTSYLGGEPQSRTVSVWPLDAHRNFTTQTSTPNGIIWDGAGELLLSSPRYTTGSIGSRQIGSSSFAYPYPTYAMRIPLGSGSASAASFQVIGGDAEYLVSEQAGKPPYQTYEEYSKHLTIKGKDYTLIPEFRISELMESYIQDHDQNFLTPLDGIFELTGTALSSSAQENFYRLYSTADFLKYFNVVDESLNNKRPGDLRIERDKISLECNGLLKFLPYKGFFPAERTAELGRLYHQSYMANAKMSLGSPSASYGPNGQEGPSNLRRRAWRIAMEPLFSPGIMYNTIKSGIASSYLVLANSRSAGANGPTGYNTAAELVTYSASVPTTANYYLTLPRPASSSLFEGVVGTMNAIYMLGNTPADITDGFITQRIPFEALYDPGGYLNSSYITGSGYIFDTGVVSGTFGLGSVDFTDMLDTGYAGPPGLTLNPAADPLYRYAIDNFLCGTMEFFLAGLSDFQSAREDQFKSVTSGSQYSMKLALYRSRTAGGLPDLDTFDMYRRETAFGFPMAGAHGGPRMQHLTPPYWSGSATATFTYTATSNGVPSLAEILANTAISYDRDVSLDQPEAPAPDSALNSQLRQMVDSCFNLTDYYNDVPAGTVTQAPRWLIQSKFETPVINVANVSASRPPVSYPYHSSWTNARDLANTGLWHQYGTIPTGSTEGIFATLEPVKDSPTSVGYDADSSLRGPSLMDIVGFKPGQINRIGEIKDEIRVEEAIVAIPFKAKKNRKDFIPLQENNTAYNNVVRMLDKYVFPPRFDFVRNPTVDPILMYAFEFSTTLTKQNLADIWQNLMPDVNKLEQQSVTVEETELIDELLGTKEDTQWMVFKVKKRAPANFEKYRRSLVTDDTSAFAPTVGDYSYNWPYDYFSLVELAQINETVRYASDDIRTPVQPRPREENNPLPARAVPSTRIRQDRAAESTSAYKVSVAEKTQTALDKSGIQTVAAAATPAPQKQSRTTVSTTTKTPSTQQRTTSYTGGTKTNTSRRSTKSKKR